MIDNQSRPRHLFAALLILSQSTAHAQPAATSTPPASQAAQEWTYAKVLAAVEWRESVLAQCSLVLGESTYLTQAGQDKFYRETQILNMWRRNGFMRFDVKERYSDPTWKLDQSWAETWDGKVNRNLRMGANRTLRPLGAISADPPPLLHGVTSLKACQVLGISSPSDLPLSTLIKATAEQDGAAVELLQRQEGGKRIIVLKMTHPQRGVPNDREYWFLPDQDFTLAKIRITMFPSTDYQDPAMAQSEFVVVDYKQFEDFWLPSHFTYELMTLNKSAKTLQRANRCEGEISRFSKAEPTDQQMRLDFPPRTRVVDAVTREAYTIQSDGSYLYEDLVDGETGRIIPPPQGKPTARGSWCGYATLRGEKETRLLTPRYAGEGTGTGGKRSEKGVGPNVDPSPGATVSGGAASVCLDGRTRPTSGASPPHCR